MPLIPNSQETRGPAEPHLALLMDDSGMRLAIPPGASLWLVEDQTQMDKIFPLVLKKVSIGKIVFEMRQADGSVTEYAYKLTTAKPKSKAAYERLIKNRGGAPVKVQR